MIVYLPTTPYKVCLIDGMGRGIIATKAIPKDSTLCECEILLLDEKDTAALHHTNLKYYTFKVSDTQDCLVLGDGEIFNHSDTPNVVYELVAIGGRLVMEFIASRDIVSGEQLFIDYSADSNVNLSEYFKIRSLI